MAFVQPTTFQPDNFLIDFPVFNQYIISTADKAKWKNKCVTGLKNLCKVTG